MLQKLLWRLDGFDICGALPTPSAFPNLRTLEVGSNVSSPRWIEGLGALQALKHLWLCVGPDTAVQFPRLDSLTYLSLFVEEGASVHLTQLPALAQLSIEGLGSAAVRPSSTAPQLRELISDIERLSVDFSYLPGLRKLSLTNVAAQLDGAGSIAACTALQNVALGGW